MFATPYSNTIIWLMAYVIRLRKRRTRRNRWEVGNQIRGRGAGGCRGALEKLAHMAKTGAGGGKNFLIDKSGSSQNVCYLFHP